MTDEPGRPREPLTIEDVERGVRVPLEQQVAGHTTSQDASSWAWDEDRRQLRLAGGL